MAGYNVFSSSTVSEGVGELRELAKTPLVYELVPSGNDPLHIQVARGKEPGALDITAVRLTQHCLQRLITNTLQDVYIPGKQTPPNLHLILTSSLSHPHLIVPQIQL